MSKTGYNPEKIPSSKENLTKVPKTKPKTIARTSKKKCLACNNGLVYNGKSYKECSGCNGQGFIQ